MGCANLGWMYKEGKGLERNYRKAVELSKKACELKEGLGCNNLGVMYYYGYGVEEDQRKAGELFKKACELGEELGCRNLAAFEDSRDSSGGVKFRVFFGSPFDILLGR